MSAVLEARGLTRILPGPSPTGLVSDIDAVFERGSFTVISRPSGSGKSSPLYMLGLLDPPTAGDVLIDGASTFALSDEERGGVRLEHFGFVFQFHFCCPNSARSTASCC
jgi:lipoprotein-releasing system ATP-binding protein